MLMERNEEMLDLAAGGFLATEPTAEAPQPAGAGKKRKGSTAEARPAVAGAGAGKKIEVATAEKKVLDSLFKEGEMLKLRVDLWEAERQWRELVHGVKTTTTQQVPAANDKKKKKKLVRVIWPDDCIKVIMEDPCMMKELSASEMEKCPKRHRQRYVMAKIINAKQRTYDQALLNQYHAFGFAYDEVEVEVADDEDKEVTGEGEVKN